MVTETQSVQRVRVKGEDPEQQDAESPRLVEIFCITIMAVTWLRGGARQTIPLSNKLKFVSLGLPRHCTPSRHLDDRGRLFTVSG